MRLVSRRRAHAGTARAGDMMFCTTFLSAPSEEPGGDGGGDGGGGVTPGGCLSTLHCLVLPQEDLYAPLPSSSPGSSASQIGRAHV